jgi:cellulose synthase/poly-beta-1,6-N-acetylglucosamine synthase-like glycosyltransferase
MAMLVTVSGWLALALQWLALFFLAYLLWPLPAALWARRAGRGGRRRAPAVKRRTRRLAVVASAHNEAAVVGALIESLQRQRYPRERYDVFLIANNCSDATAVLARSAGARVYERETGGRGTKGAALAWWWEQLGPARDAYDVVVVLDADNLAPPEFLAGINEEFNQWPAVAVVQARRLPKNPDTSLASRLDAVSELVSQSVGQAGRRAVGLSGFIIGSGTAYQREVFTALAGDYRGALNEDAEWQLRLALAGQRLRWTPDTVFYDEKTARFDQIERQRTRWLRGKLELIRLYAWPLLRAAVSRADPVCLDQLLFIVQPPRSLLLLALAGLGVLSAAVAWLLPEWSWLLLPAWVWATALGLFAAAMLAGLALAGAPRGLYLALAGAPLFILRFVIATARALASPRRREWVPTQREQAAGSRQ